ncbi:MAG: S-layer homology domain-containing protein [Clostridia bacterium]|nr:S-layer homology domain-containing protein [Clostridia bacterium]
MKKIIALITIFVLVFGISSFAQNIGMENFKIQISYGENTYSDISADSWYKNNVKECFELGLMLGNGDGTFNPEGYVTLAEAVTMAVRVHSTYNSKQIEITESVNWYDDYVKYAGENSIIKKDEFADFKKYATRAQLAYIFSNSLPEIEFNKINRKTAISDMKATDRYYNEILKLYNAGIVVGSNEKKDFFPNSNIIRAEAAAIIGRVAVKNSRIMIDYNDQQIEDDFIEEPPVEDIPEEIPVYNDQIIDEEDPFAQIEGVTFDGEMTNSITGLVSYVSDAKTGVDKIEISIKGEYTGNFDMSKIKLGYIKVNWSEEDVKAERINKDITLSGNYERCENEEELSPGKYYSSVGQVYDFSYTKILICIKNQDSKKIHSIEDFENVGFNPNASFGMMLEEGWAKGAEGKFIIIDNIVNVVTINDFKHSDEIYYYVKSMNGGSDSLFITEGEELEVFGISENYILVHSFCNSVTFCDSYGNITKVIDITPEVLQQGIKVQDII